MKILITGAFKCSDIQIQEIENLGHECIFLQDEKDEINVDKTEIDAIICNGFFLYHNIEEYSNLKYIQLTSAGLDRVPLDYIRKNKIQLYNARGVYSIPMAEWTLLKLLEIYKNSRLFYKNQENKRWEKDREIQELNGKIATIVGYGSVGNEIAKRLNAFNVKINIVDITEKKDEYIENFYNINELEKAMQTTDILILTLPLTKETEGIINNNVLNKMKDESVLINISRGKVINENDLINVIKLNKFKGVALDVFEEEPLREDSELWNFENVIITPHNSFIGENNNKRLFELIMKNLKIRKV